MTGAAAIFSLAAGFAAEGLIATDLVTTAFALAGAIFVAVRCGAALFGVCALHADNEMVKLAKTPSQMLREVEKEFILLKVRSKSIVPAPLKRHPKETP